MSLRRLRKAYRLAGYGYLRHPANLRFTNLGLSQLVNEKYQRVSGMVYPSIESLDERIDIQVSEIVEMLVNVENFFVTR